MVLARPAVLTRNDAVGVTPDADHEQQVPLGETMPPSVKAQIPPQHAQFRDVEVAVAQWAIEFPKWLPEEAAFIAIVKARRHTRSPIGVLLEDNTISRTELFEMLAVSNEINFVDLEHGVVEVDADSIQSASMAILMDAKVLPMKTETGVVLACADPNSKAAKGAVARMYEDTSIAKIVLGDPIAILSQLRRAEQNYVLDDSETFGEEQGQLNAQSTPDITSIATVATDESSNVAWVRSTIDKAYENRASDIHLSMDEQQRLIVRFRVDGQLRQQVSPSTDATRVINATLQLCSMDIGAQRSTQSKRLSHRTQKGRNLNIRAELLPSIYGPKITMRLLDSSAGLRRLDDMGLEKSYVDTLKSAIRRSHGMLVTTGPTGSGKALALSTVVPTPDGATTMGQVEVGDTVLGRDGRPCRVEKVWDVNDAPTLFRVTFSDGQQVIADIDHQWLVADHHGRAAPRTKKGVTAIAAYDAALADASELEMRGGNWNGPEAVTARELHGMLVEVGLDTHYPSHIMVHRALGTVDCPHHVEKRGRGKGAVHLYPTDIALKSLGLRLRQRYSSRPAGQAMLHRMTTGEMVSAGLRRSTGHSQYAVPLAQPLDLPAADLSVDPYLLGYWLGYGTTGAGHITVGDEGITEALAALSPTRPITDQTRVGASWRLTFGRPDGLVNRDLAAELRAVGVINHKHIPAGYLRGSYEQRLALLRGLMDTHGTVDERGCCELSLCDERLATDAQELIRGLGIKTSTSVGPASHVNDSGELVQCKDCHRVRFTPNIEVFGLVRKRARQATRLSEGPSEISKWLYITDVQPVGDGDDGYEPARCITVDSDDRTYLIGDGYLVTSNTTTQYGLLQEVMGKNKEIITIEDPVEYKLRGLTQTEVNLKARTGVTWERAIESCMRSDPDIILVGETRDAQTAQAAVRAAMTGHLVLTTLHTTSALGAYARLIDLGVERYLVADQLTCAIGQRLVPRLCSCKEEREIPKVTKVALARAGITGMESAYFEIGCNICDGTGIIGRAALMELLVPDGRTRDLVMQGATQEQLLLEMPDSAYLRFNIDGERLMRAGTCSPEGVLPFLAEVNAGIHTND
jgi:type II secretory ATPase GspE/PulE/Tfp pilus assembly ATPase PilB-like protein